jgi:hypothetical protein
MWKRPGNRHFTDLCEEFARRSDYRGFRPPAGAGCCVAFAASRASFGSRSSAVCHQRNSSAMINPSVSRDELITNRPHQLNRVEFLFLAATHLPRPPEAFGSPAAGDPAANRLSCSMHLGGHNSRTQVFTGKLRRFRGQLDHPRVWLLAGRGPADAGQADPRARCRADPTRLTLVLERSNRPDSFVPV